MEKPVYVAEGCSALIQEKNPRREVREPLELPVGHYAVTASEIDSTEKAQDTEQ